MKKIIVIGTIGQDAENKTFKDKVYTCFSLAESESYKDKDTGERKEITTWFNCLKYGENPNLLQYLKKGAKLYVEGTPENRAYLSSKTQKAEVAQNINITNLSIISFAKGEGEKAERKNFKTSKKDKEFKEEISRNGFVDDDETDDLPF